MVLQDLFPGADTNSLLIACFGSSITLEVLWFSFVVTLVFVLLLLLLEDALLELMHQRWGAMLQMEQQLMLQCLFRMVTLVTKVMPTYNASPPSSMLTTNGMSQVSHEVLINGALEATFLTS